jgi:protein tyrosine phosphatase (PTP) superfamily phosphohydrolase (DUF442 family)
MALAALWYFFGYDNFHEVVQGRVYRSKQLSGQELQLYINENNIRSIINLRDEQKDKSWYEVESEIAKKNGINIYNLGLSAYHLPAVERINLIIEALLTADRPVLIHCSGGAHRTGFVSALALAIEMDAPISSLKKQFSWRYGAIPVPNHVGPLFFTQYENWLQKKNKKHSRSNLLFWINNEYMDGYGNLRFNIDDVNKKSFKQISSAKKLRATLSPGSKPIIIRGWAVSARSKAPVQNLFVVIGTDSAKQVDYQYLRPDVGKHFKLDEEYYNSIELGWLVKFEAGTVSSGCHGLSFRIVKEDSSHVNVDTDWEICLE